MEQKTEKFRAKVTRTAPCSYRIESSRLTGNDKRRGLIIESGGETLIVPFKRSNPLRKKAHDVRISECGKLRLSSARQKLTLTITLDREDDSPERFREECEKLIDGYVLDVLKYEINECLE